MDQLAVHLFKAGRMLSKMKLGFLREFYPFVIQQRHFQWSIVPLWVWEGALKPSVHAPIISRLHSMHKSVNWLA